MDLRQRPRWRHRRRNTLTRLLVGLVASATLTVVCWSGLWTLPQDSLSNSALSDARVSSGSARMLLAASAGDTTVPSISTTRVTTPENTNCTPQAIAQFPRDIFTDNQRRHGWIVMHMLVALYTFIGLAFVCDDYFVPCLELICDALNLTPDVGGATFMAAGSSAPELATAIIGVFIAKDDIALSSVVGSAVYNVTFVIAVCGFFVPCVVYLNWFPLARDSVYYAICVLLLTYIICDDIVTWYESAILLLFYLLYIVLMYHNPAISEYFNHKCRSCLPPEQPVPVINSSSGSNSGAARRYDKLETGSNGSCEQLEMSESSGRHSETSDILPEVHLRNGSSARISRDVWINVKGGQNGGTHGSLEDSCSLDSGDDASTSEDSEWVLAWPEGHCSRFLHIILLPLKLCTFLTIPDCRRPRLKRLYCLTFINSCLWISALAYVMIWMITVAGHTFHIPDSIMGLSFVAAGASVPDAIASVIVVRNGEGDMAVSNAVGSNVFDILVCMGVPWFLMTVISGKNIRVYSRGLVYSTLTLMSTVVLLLVVTYANRWRLDKKLGIALLLIYCLFMCLAILYELNFFGYVHPPECPFET